MIVAVFVGGIAHDLVVCCSGPWPHLYRRPNSRKTVMLPEVRFQKKGIVARRADNIAVVVNGHGVDRTGPGERFQGFTCSTDNIAIKNDTVSTADVHDYLVVVVDGNGFGIVAGFRLQSVDSRERIYLRMAVLHLHHPHHRRYHRPNPRPRPS